MLRLRNSFPIVRQSPGCHVAFAQLLSYCCLTCVTPINHMLLDILTLAAILTARDQLAAQQFLRQLTYRPYHIQIEGIPDYPKVIVLKAVAIAGLGAKEWLQALY